MSDELIGCGSHSCAVSPPVGVGNNTSCRCMVSDYRGQSLVRSLQARIDELENEVRLQKSNAGGAYERIAELQARVDELEGWNAEMVEKAASGTLFRSLIQRIAELESTFRHTHSAIDMDGDACATCGLDLRDPIHERAGE